MNESEVKLFWDAHPCGEEAVAGIKNTCKEFFDLYDRFRYSQAPHILKCLDAIDFYNKSVLEIGLGLGADSEQIIRRGGIWSGIDLSHESVSRVKERLIIRGLPYISLQVGTARALPFADNSFDIVFSYGVLHHIPDIDTAQREIGRVLKPNGHLIIMLYAKHSLNYLISIAVIRRIAFLFLYLLRCPLSEKICQHIANADECGLLNYLKIDNFIHKNTDGPLNPYSKVYDLKEVRTVFSCFRILKWHKEFMHAPPLPVSKLPLAGLLGWHLWVQLEPLNE